MREIDQIAQHAVKLLMQVPETKLLAGLFAIALKYFFPTEAIESMAGGAALLVMVDLVTGMRAARVVGEAWTSAKFSSTINKLIAYMSLLAVGAVNTHHIPGAAAFASTAQVIFLAFIIVRESGSIIENCRKMGIDVDPRILKWLTDRAPKPPEDSGPDPRAMGAMRGHEPTDKD